MLAPQDRLVLLAFENHTTAMEDLLCPLLLFEVHRMQTKEGTKHVVEGLLQE